MNLFEVRLKRTQSATVWVEAVDSDDAADAAEAVVEESEWVATGADVDAEITEHDTVPVHVVRYWSGGESGAWVVPGVPA